MRDMHRSADPKPINDLTTDGLVDNHDARSPEVSPYCIEPKLSRVSVPLSQLYQDTSNLI